MFVLFFSKFVAELYIDEKKQSFKDLGYKRFSLLSLPGLLLSRIARSQAAKVLMHINYFERNRFQQEALLKEKKNKKKQNKTKPFFIG